MSDYIATENTFLKQITAVVEENLANEQFGVSELADAMNMSRSNLLRRVKKETRLSVSQLIRQVRLKRGMEMLLRSGLNVSEVSHQVGFSSTSYFIKCFREHYGYSPGEAGKRSGTETEDAAADLGVAPSINRKRKYMLAGAVAFTLVLAVGLLVYFEPASKAVPLEKSIAVLPFKNDSNDSTNVYLINGLMEATLNNLQKIKDLKVISRTSAEKYRNTARTIPEMAKDLNVSYFVEGSGQKIGDQILLNIQLIEASTDRHLWSRQYRREARDIFKLQQEIASNITEEIQVIITPEEEKQIGKRPTDDLVAYDLFLKGRELYYRGGTANLDKAIYYYKQAIDRDPKFALAYAEAVIVWYYLDMFRAEKKHEADMNNYADKALLLDPKLANSLVAKALFYMQRKEYDQAVPYFEKALEYHPNSVLVINFLSDLYGNYIPNTSRYLEYALKGIRLGIGSRDSISESYNYLHLSNALIQSGFVDAALENVNKSLAYNPHNPFSGYLKVYILFARSRDLQQTKQLLIRELDKDTTRMDILQEVGKVCYMLKDYKSAYHYYNRFMRIKDAGQLDIYRHENLKIAMVLDKMGFKEKAEAYVRDFKQFADNDRSVYKHALLAGYYAYTGDKQKAVDYFKRFAKEDNFQYWILLICDDPMLESLKGQPGFDQVAKDIETRFWATHEKLRRSLEEQGLL